MTSDIYTEFGIDSSKLKRDYIKYPLHITKNGRGSEKPYKEDLEYLYITLNFPMKKLIEYFSVNKQILERSLKFYGIKKPKYLIYQNINSSMLKTYGVKYLLQSKDYQNKLKSKIKEKYGVEYFSQTDEYKKKIKQTKLEKYGDENYTNKEKREQTCLKKYGVEHPFQSKEVQEKIKQSNLEKYGVKNPAQKHLSKEMINVLSSKEKLKSFIENQPHKTYNYLSSIIGITPSNIRKHIIKYDLEDLIVLDSNESSYELELQKLYPDMIKHYRKLLDGKEIDLYNEDKKIGIEFNGDYWHNEYGKEKLYHQNKSLLAESKGIFLYHIFEYEWETKREQIINQLNNLLGINQTKFYARSCIIKEVGNKEKEEFLIKNHLQGNDKSSIKLGLYYKNELVSLMTFVKPRFNKKYQWELSRFCSKAGCNVIGGASKLFKFFIDNYKPESIISYSNIAHTRGNLYNMLKFNLQGISEPNYVWSNGVDILSRYQCQKHKLLEQGYQGSSEIDIMHNLGYYRIFDCGNKVWVWKC